MRIEDVKTPEVGIVYNVPFVGGIPVCGRPHTDNELYNSTPRHWHADTRFTNSNLAMQGTARRGEFVCLRTRPLPIGDLELHQMALYAEFEHRYGQVCSTCPHKGMPIHAGVCSGHRINWVDFVPPFYLKIGEYTCPLQAAWIDKKFHFVMDDNIVQLVDSENQLMVELDMYVHNTEWERGDTLILSHGTPQ